MKQTRTQSKIQGVQWKLLPCWLVGGLAAGWVGGLAYWLACRLSYFTRSGKLPESLQVTYGRLWLARLVCWLSGLADILWFPLIWPLSSESINYAPLPHRCEKRHQQQTKRVVLQAGTQSTWNDNMHNVRHMCKAMRNAQCTYTNAYKPAAPRTNIQIQRCDSISIWSQFAIDSIGSPLTPFRYFG